MQLFFDQYFGLEYLFKIANSKNLLLFKYLTLKRPLLYKLLFLMPFWWINWSFRIRLISEHAAKSFMVSCNELYLQICNFILGPKFFAKIDRWFLILILPSRNLYISCLSCYLLWSRFIREVTRVATWTERVGSKYCIRGMTCIIKIFMKFMNSRLYNTIFGRNMKKLTIFLEVTLWLHCSISECWIELEWWNT